MSKQRRKGSDFERQVAGIISDYLGEDVKRTLLSGIRGEGDIEGLTCHMECKRQERLKLSEWFNKEAGKAGMKPMALVHKQNRSPIFVTMTLMDWMNLFREAL